MTLKQIFEKHSINLSSFAARAGYTRSALKRIVAGDMSLSVDRRMKHEDKIRAAIIKQANEMIKDCGK